MKSTFFTTLWVVVFGMGITAWADNASAQDNESNRATSALLEEITVTARKREEDLTDVPVAVSVMSDRQIDALKIHNLNDVAIGAPNVDLKANGTVRGTANFTIRGIGMAGSIAGVDPTVGVFIDGVYIGLNNGIILDAFDLDNIQVLRGPQGTLFGRNVTGGAVLMNTKDPTEEFELKLRTAVDGNPNGDGATNYYVMGMVNGVLSENLSARLVAYYNDDGGWLTNQFDGSDYGKIDTKMVRPSIRWTPSDSVELVVKYEYQDVDSDGAAGQSFTNGLGVPGTPANFDRDTYDFSNDERGLDNREVNFLTAELNWDVALGDGTVTNIFGWRDIESETRVDIDSQPVWLFHAGAEIDYEQWSNELRYVGTFGDVDLTTGLLVYSNETKYGESRDLLGIATGNVAPALTQHGGGRHEVDSIAWFGSVDYALNDLWALNVGLNVTREEKDAKIASLIYNINAPCSVVDGNCPFDFIDDDSWTNYSPRIGLTRTVGDDAMVYGHWARGYRSGLYNLRNTNADVVNFGPGPIDEERADSVELGYKMGLASGGNISLAAFYTEYKDTQRVINTADPVSGVVQSISNAADVEIFGFEFDGTFPLTENLVLLASLGYTDASYSEVREDLTGDGSLVDDQDLDVIFAPEWTYSARLVYDTQLGDWGTMNGRIGYRFRDDFAYLDNNLEYEKAIGLLDAGVDFATDDGRWVFGLYGKNLTNEVLNGGITVLPSDIGGVPLGGTFTPLLKGRLVGVDVTYTF